MEEIIQQIKEAQTSQQPQVIYIDGCKITVQYSGQDNPSTIKDIRDILISGGTAWKN
mgnify:CR=1 FL=1